MKAIASTALRAVLGLLLILVILTAPGIIRRDGEGVVVRFSFILTAADDLAERAADGSIFEYRALRTPRNMLDTLPRSMLTSFSYLLGAAYLALILGTMGGLFLGIRRNARTPGFLMLIGATPDFMIAVYLQILAIAFFQATGMRLARIGYLAGHPAILLPMVTLVIVAVTVVTRLVGDRARAIAGEEYILYARSRGYTRRRIIFRHLLPGVLGSLEADLSRILGILMASLFITERMFRIPGITSFMFQFAFAVGFDPVARRSSYAAQFNVALISMVALLVVYAALYLLSLGLIRMTRRAVSS